MEMISLVLKGDQQAYAELVGRYQHFVFTTALKYTQNREDAEEIAQDHAVGGDEDHAQGHEPGE